MSNFRQRGSGGFDHDVAKEIARRLGLSLNVTWYESEEDEENDPFDEINAMLSFGLCDLAASFPLVGVGLKPAQGKTGMLPRYRNIPPENVGRHIDLKPLAVSIAYRAAPITVVLGPSAKGRQVRRLSDLAGLKILAEQGTVAGTIAFQYGGGLFRKKLTIVAPGPRTLWLLEAGNHDAAIIELEKFDNHRMQNRVTKLTAAAYEHSIFFNLAFVALAENRTLIGRINAILPKMRAGGRLKAIARRNGASYRRPRAPFERRRISIREFMAD